MSKRHGVGFWQAHLDGWRRSELTQQAYCAEHGLSTKSLCRWRRKEKDAVAAGATPLTLVPLNVSAPATGGAICLHSPGGWRIELPAGETPWLADLLRRLPLMLTPTQVWVVVEAIDMRAGIDGLSQRIQNALGRSPCDGSAYAFRNRRQNRLKLLIWDGTGVWLCQRRLHRGHFTWPSADTPVCTLTAGQWQWLVTGVEWQRLEAPPLAHWRA